MEQRHCPDAELIVGLASRVLEEALSLGLSDHDHRGGYFCIADNKTGEPLDLVKLGEMKQTKEGRYEMLAQEKARRLAEHSAHRTSYESRNPQLDRWGGAIKVSHIFSFSGLSEALDEALVLVVARAYLGWMNADVGRQCDRMAGISGNDTYWKLLTNIGQRTRFILLGASREKVTA